MKNTSGSASNNKSKQNQQQQQQQSSPFVDNSQNFPLIDDEFNIVGSRRKPSADLASPNGQHKSPDLFNRNPKASSKAYKNSRGTAKNDNNTTGGQWQMAGAKQGPLTPVNISDRKANGLQVPDTSVGHMTDVPLQSYQSQLNHKHRSIDETKIMAAVNNPQLRTNMDIMHARHKKQSSNQTFLQSSGQKDPSIELLQQAQMKQGIHISQTGRETKQSSGGDVLSPSAQNFRSYVEQHTSHSPQKSFNNETILNSVAKQSQMLYYNNTEPSRHAFQQSLNSQQAGIMQHSSPPTQLGSPTYKKGPLVGQALSQNHESSFLPKIDKSHNVNMMIGMSHQTSQQDTQNSHGQRQNSTSQNETHVRRPSGFRRTEFNTQRVAGSDNTNKGAKHQITSYENKVAAFNQDYLANTQEFNSQNRQRRDKVDYNKMKGQNVTQYQMVGGTAAQMLNPSTMPPGKSHHVKAHSQNFESPGLGGYPAQQANLLIPGGMQYVQGQYQKQGMNMMQGQNQHPAYHHQRRDRLNDSQLREKQDKQLEDLNETLQRLAREKYTKNVPGGAGGLQGRKKMRNNTNGGDKAALIGDNQYMIAGIDPIFSQLQGFDKFQAQNNGVPQHQKESASQNKKDRKKKKKQAQNMDLMQQKLESQQRSALIMGDPLVNQRLQGVKQGSKNPNQTQQAPAQQMQANRASVEPQYQYRKTTPSKGAIDSPLRGNEVSASRDHENVDQRESSQGQKVFKIHMTLIDKSQSPQQHDDNRIDANTKASPEKAIEESRNSAILGSSSLQQMHRNGIKISTEEPLVIRNNNIVMQKVQSPVSFRQSQDSSGTAQPYRNTNLIGPEKILNSSIAIESQASQMQHHQQPNYHTLNRFNSQMDQEQQATPISSQNEPPNGGMQTPFTQSKMNLKNTGQSSIWTNASLQTFHQQAQQQLINQGTDLQGGPLPRSSRLLASDGAPLPAQQYQGSPSIMAPKNYKVLHIGNNKQFSSVIEDVEMEAQASPLRKKKTLHSVVSGGPSFQIQRTIKGVGNSSPKKQNDRHDGQSSRRGQEMDSRMQTQTSKQELISEIKYHFSQQKEDIKALQAAHAHGSPEGSPKRRGKSNNYNVPGNIKSDLDVYDKHQNIVNGQFMFSNQDGVEMINPRSPQFAGTETDVQGADSTAQSFIPSREAQSHGQRQHDDQQAFQMILNRSSRMNETMNNMNHQSSKDAKSALQATFGKVGLATQQDFTSIAVRKSPGNRNNQRGGQGMTLMGNTKDSSQKLPMLTRQSPAAVGLLPATALRGGQNDIHVMRASMRDNHQYANNTHHPIDHNSLDGQGKSSGLASHLRQQTTIEYDRMEPLGAKYHSPDAQFIQGEPSIDFSNEGNKPFTRKRNNHQYQMHVPPNVEGLNPQNPEEQKLILALKQGRMSRNKAVPDQDKIKLHMSQVFSARSQDHQEAETGRGLKSLTDNVQIIHPGVQKGEKFLTYNYSGSPGNIKLGNNQVATGKQLQDISDNYHTISQSKQSQRNASSINRHYNKQQSAIMIDTGGDNRKYVQKTNTQRLGSEIASSVAGGNAHANHQQQSKQQQHNEKIIQTQLKDLSGQVSVSKMLNTDGQVCLEYPGQNAGKESSRGKVGKGKSKLLAESPRRPGGDHGQANGNQSNRGASKQGNAPHSRNDPNASKTSQGNNGTISSQNQQQRKTFNTSPSKKDRHGSQIRQDTGQGSNKPPIQKRGDQQSRPGTPQTIEPGDVSSDAPENYNHFRLGFRVPRDNYSFCHEYVQFKGQNKLPKECRHLFTSRSYQKGEQQFPWSTRLYLSKECALSEDRRRYPVLIVNLDGAIGMWDDFKKNHYVLRPKVVEGLIQLSYDFRLVAVSSHRQKHISRVVQALMNIPPGSQPTGGTSVDASNNNQLLHLVFDAVYQLNSQNKENKFTNAIKNIDEIHFDLTQPLTDMQFEKHKKKKVNSNSQHDRDMDDLVVADKYQTFWETREYRPCKKVLILTTNRWLFKSRCYSFDYNYLFQARKFIHEESKKAPIVLQMPHMRLCPKISFDMVLQTIFTLQNVAQALSCKRQDAQKCVEGEIYNNPKLSGFGICKKFLSSKLRHQNVKMKKDGNVRGLRVFDQQKDIFVDLELIDFGAAYKFLKDYLSQRKSDWLATKKYYLLYKPERVEITPLKLKQNLKVTFEESPDIRRIGDEQRDKAGSSLNGRAGATTHDSSKSDKFSFVKNQYISEEAKNCYNALMIRNYKIQQEINAYARHHRIQQQKKIEQKKEQDRLTALQEENQTPIVIYDSDKDDNRNYQEPKLRSSLKEYPTHKMNLEKEKMEQENKMKNKKQEKEKKYAFKYRVVQIRMNDDIVIDESDLIMKNFAVINLKINPTTQYALRVPGQVNDGTYYAGLKESSQGICATPRYVANQDYLQHNANTVLDGYECRNFLIDLLSKRQTKISYSTNQEMHLKNNLNQLVDGEQQYKDQQNKLTQDEKEQLDIQKQQEKANGDHLKHNKDNDKQENYLDKI